MTYSQWNNATLWRVALAAGGTSVLSLSIADPSDTATATATSTTKGKKRVLQSYSGYSQKTGSTSTSSLLPLGTSAINTTNTSSSATSIYSWISSMQSMSSPIISTEMEAASAITPDNNNIHSSMISSKNSNNNKEYDFVVIGHGIVGQSAVANLQKLCPQATIAVLDPNLPLSSNKQRGKAATTTTTSAAAVDYYPTICAGFHPLTRQVQCRNMNMNMNNHHQSEKTAAIRYRHAVLVATGSRGAPPPHYLLDERALERILELRPTLVPLSSSTDDNVASDATGVAEQDHDNSSATQQQQQQQRPIQTPRTIRKKVLQAAKHGHKVAILGSGWEAVELAIAISSAATALSTQRRKKKSATTTTLVFGGKGVLSHVLPQYLSSAVSKRLQSRKIQIQDRSLIRYIGGDTQHDNQLNLYTAKSYDLLDSGRTSCEWLIVAPEVSGPMGTATLPTTNIPAHLESAQDGRAWYQTWSHLTTTKTTTYSSHQDNMNKKSMSTVMPTTSTNLIACYADDGRIAVNAELSAGNGVYAAGSVAKYPNPWTGNADTAGVGVHDGRQAGQVAAQNMARDYQQRTGGGIHQHRFGLLGGSSSNKTTGISQDSACLKHPIPVWRSDQMPYTEHDYSNSLQEAGIQALCVGSCDSDRFSTQGFWWTNQSKRFRTLVVGQDDSSGGRRRITKRNTNTTTTISDNNNNNNNNKDHPLDSKPVYGRGVVYYMDQEAGQIQGIMLWGLPFTNNNHDQYPPGDLSSNATDLNETLIHHMEEIIRTNGGFSNLGMESELERVQFVRYLTEQSRQLVVDSIEPFTVQNASPDDLPRPLIRYTEVRPANIRRVRVLNRRHESQGHGFLGEDLFARCSTDNNATKVVPPAPLPKFDNLREVSESDAEASTKLQSPDTSRDERTAIRRSRTQAMQDWAIWEWYQRRWEENEDLARPPKEDQLWLRKGDENRGVSSRERFNESMMKAIFPEGR